jgi:hypothetical protein
MISEAQDHLLPWSARVGLRLHLLLCGQCRRYRTQIRWLRRVFEQYPKAMAQERMPEEARRDLVRRLNQISQ